MNKRVKDKRSGVVGLDAYNVPSEFVYPNLMTGSVTEVSALSTQSRESQVREGPAPQDFQYRLKDFGERIVGFAMDWDDFFHFSKLRKYFPHLTGVSEFMQCDNYLGGVWVTVHALPDDLCNLTSRQKVDVVKFVLRQIASSVRSNSNEYVGTREFQSFEISTLFADKTLSIREQGEAGLSWKNGDSKILRLHEIDPDSTEWYVYDDSYGTDQEKYFIKYLNSQAKRLMCLYEDFYLLRNEKAVKLFAFDSGQGFEPDFILILRKKSSAPDTILQLFIEPKGEHLQEHDQWKQDFLQSLELKAVLPDGRYKVYGLPFFNETETGRRREDFNEAFQDVVS